MITIPQLTAHALGSFLAQETQDLFGSSPSGLPELLPFAARLTLECIGNSDALYHNIEHTMLVTLVGHDILVGRALQRTTTVSRLCELHYGLPHPRHRLRPRRRPG